MDAWALGQAGSLGTGLLALLSRIRAHGSTRSHARPRRSRTPPPRLAPAPCSSPPTPSHSEWPAPWSEVQTALGVCHFPAL